MAFIASSLGVNCTFCHVEGHFDKDDKKPKQTARAMMRMTLALNKNNFDSRREITCYSCHRGAQHPADAPEITGASESHNVATTGTTAPSLPTNLPTVTEILDKYVTTLGGAAAIEQITSRIEKGSIVSGGNSTPIEILTASPAKQSFTRRLSIGNATTIFEGTQAWFIMPGRPPRPLQGSDLDFARLDADLQFPLHLLETFPNLRREYPEKIAGGEAWLLIGEREGFPPVKFYFDQQSGLLIRQIRYADSALGELPTQIDYSDFRSSNGIQLPFRRTVSQPNSRETIQLTEIQQNIPIDDSHFHPPKP